MTVQLDKQLVGAFSGSQCESKRFWRPLKVNPEYAKLVPKLSSEDYSALEASIIANKGAFEPIKINSKDEILDGHTRYDICTKNAVGFTTEIVELPNSLDEKIYVIETNLKRRQLNPYQSIVLNLILEPLLKEKGQQNLIRERDEKGLFTANVQNCTTAIEKVDSLGTIAEKSHVSRRNVAKVKKIQEKAPEETKQKLNDGKQSIDSAYKEVQKSEKPKTESKPLPKGDFDIIYADPPWSYKVNGLRGDPEENYATMKTDDICALTVPSSQNAILFLWATNPLLEEALKVMQSWGFKYKTNLVWVKNRMGVGFWFRGQHELLLVGVKGDVHPPEPENRFTSCLSADIREHSQKPDEVYQIIEKMFPFAKAKLEMFARKKREGWEAWGNEV